MTFTKKISVQNRDFIVVAPPLRPSNKYKKYEVYNYKGKYITSFGDIRYEHYFDKIEYPPYKQLNHLDKSRRNKYKERHANDNITNPNYGGYWSYHFLW